MSEEIIIDDINVAECKHLINDRLHNCECMAECTVYPETAIYDDCKGINCYFKQLKRLEQQIEAYQLSENEAKEIIAELKHRNKRLQEENKSLQMLSCANCGEQFLSPEGAELYDKNVQLQKENEELKEDINKRTHCISCQRELENCRLSITNAKYKQALEEIRNITDKLISDGLDIGGNTRGGGGGGTTNHAALSNLAYTDSGHTGFMSDDGFIPLNTIITVKKDGTANYTSLQDALAYLENKWSNGAVYIDVYPETHTTTSTIVIGNKFNAIPKLVIRRMQGETGTFKIQNTSSSAVLMVSSYTQDLTLSNLELECTNATKPFAVFQVDTSSVVRTNNLSVKGAQWGVFVGGVASILYPSTSLTIDDCSVCGMEAQNASNIIVGQIPVNISNTPLGVRVQRLSTIIFIASTITFTSVTTQYNQTINTQTTAGFIYKD